MYMYAPTGLAHTLGQPTGPSPSAQLEAFLSRVNTSPEKYGTLLATVTLHPKPMDSPLWGRQGFPIGTQHHSLVDAIMFAGVEPVDILDRLRQISIDFRKRSRAWQRLIEGAVKLRGEYMEAMSVLGRRPEALGPYPIRTLLPPPHGETEASNLARLGYGFAKEKLPPGLVKRMPTAFDAHHYMVGRWLQRYAEVRVKRDPAFRRQVEEKLKTMLETKDPSVKRQVQERLKLLKP
jgi:hypothetical protein